MINYRPVVKSQIPGEIIKRTKHKVALLLGYCGDNYYGSQYNKQHDTDLKRPTIEGELFIALSKSNLISELNAQCFNKNHFQRTTRTDRGVHALGNVISVKILNDGMSIQDNINSYLPDDIRVWQVQRVNKNFNARKACGSRIYEYVMPTYILGFGIEKLEGLLGTNMTKSFGEEDLRIIKRYPTLSVKDHAHLIPMIHNYLKDSHSQLMNYQLSEQRWGRFRSTLKMFMGTHNFHNYTSLKTINNTKDSSKRHIMNIDITKPYQIVNHPGEWISITLEGQSFLLHQIRKMVSMSIMSMVYEFSPSYITKTFDSELLSIPKAPSSCLILEETKFISYNKKLQQLGYDQIIFDKCQDPVNKFKTDHILPHIVQKEANDFEFVKYLHYICYSKFAHLE